MRNNNGKFSVTKYLLKDHHGFSMVEMMVTLLIFSIIIAGLYGALAVGERSWEVNQVKVELHQELRSAMDWIKYDLIQAGPSSISDVLADDTWYSEITFQIPDTNGIATGAISWDTNTINYRVGGTNNNEIQRVYNSSTKVICDSIQSLQFRRMAAASDIVEVSMLGSKDTSKGQNVDYLLNFQIQLRN